MLRSETVKEIIPALLLAQKEIEPVVKDKIAKGTKFTFAYADLSAVLEAVTSPLNKNNIVLMQATVPCGGGEKSAIETMLYHTSGEFIGSLTPLCNVGEDPQSFGIAVTYAKRYGLSALLGVATEDKDGDIGKPKDKGIRKPNDQEQSVIDKVYEKLIDSAPEGHQVSKTKLASVLYALKGSYPSDEKIVGTIVAYFLNENRINGICIKTELS